VSARLDAIAKARTNYVTKRATLEHELRNRLEEELSAARAQLDVAIRLAFDGGESKASIGRAMGTKDYGTINAALARTEGVEDIIGVDPLDSVFSIDGDTLTVDYVRHGTRQISGSAQFTIAHVDGKPMLSSLTPLWDATYTTRNETVRALDGVLEGEYFDEFVEWFQQKGASVDND
jgi:hypothetical protein